MNIVAVSDHVFHRIPFDLLIQVSATQLSMFLCIPSVFMANDRTCEDAVDTSLLGSPTPLFSNFGSPNGSAADVERTGIRTSTCEDKIYEIHLQLPLFLQKVTRIENSSRRFHRQWPLLRLRLQEVNILLEAWQPALPPWKQVQPLLEAFSAQQSHFSVKCHNVALHFLKVKCSDR